MKIVCIKMRYSIEPRDRIYIKGYGFLSFAKNILNSLSNKYGQKLLDSAKKSATDTIKTASERVIQKTAEATGDLIGNKIADNITMLYRQIHLFIGDAFHVLPCTHYQAILLSIKFLFLQAYFLHISLKPHLSK